MCLAAKRKNHIIRNDSDDDDDSDVRGLILSRYSIDQEATGLQPTTARTIEIDAHMHRFQRYAQRAKSYRLGRNTKKTWQHILYTSTFP